MSVELDRGVRKGIRQGRAVLAEAGKDGDGQRSRSGAVLDERERRRSAESLPGFGDLPGERRPEDRMQLGSRQEVPPRVGRAAAAV